MVLDNKHTLHLIFFRRTNVLQIELSLHYHNDQRIVHSFLLSLLLPSESFLLMEIPFWNEN